MSSCCCLDRRNFSCSLYVFSQVPCIFFFFKQKTAYEMRISDWSSDVCSSDLTRTRRCVFAAAAKILHVGLQLDHPHGRMAVAGLSRRSPYSATVRRIRDRKSTRLNSSQ